MIPPTSPLAPFTPPRRPGTRPLLVATLVLLALGAATGLTAPHWPGIAPGSAATADPASAAAPAAAAEPASAAGTDQGAPAPPRGLRIELLLDAGEIDAAARARITWTHPGPSGEAHVELRWHELPENYAAHSGTHAVYGRSSAVLTVPPGLTRLCVQARTLRDDGAASAVEVACLPAEES